VGGDSTNRARTSSRSSETGASKDFLSGTNQTKPILLQQNTEGWPKPITHITMLQLPVVLKKGIVSYLNAPEAQTVARSCKAMYSDLALSTLLPPLKICPPQHWMGAKDTGDIPRCGPEIPLVCGVRRIHSIQLTCSWKDQGWGNRKGRLFIVSHNSRKAQAATATNETTTTHLTFENGRVLYTSPIASHGVERLTMSFSPTRNDEEDDWDDMSYHIWYIVGGGGGHGIYLLDLRAVYTIFDDEDCIRSGSPSKKYRAEAYRALYQGGVLQGAFLSKKHNLFYPTLLHSLVQTFLATLTRAAEGGTTTIGSNDLVRYSGPVLASWCDSNGISLEEGSLVAIEELISFVLTVMSKANTDYECKDHSVDDDSDESMMDDDDEDFRERMMDDENDMFYPDDDDEEEEEEGGDDSSR
jgi:hypothetical protein